MAKVQEMTAAAVLKELEALGTEQNRKVYPRHGVVLPLFGVSFANFKLLKKRLKTNQQLAEELWDSTYWDARILACMIAPPNIPKGKLESWVKDLSDYCLSDQLGGLASTHLEAQNLAEKYANKKGEWPIRFSYCIVSNLALSDKEIPDEWFRSFIHKIQSTIHTSPNYTKAGMNNALIAIGTRNEVLKQESISAAETIGIVKVDHGLTNCKTPEAIPYIEKAFAHRHRNSKSGRS